MAKLELAQQRIDSVKKAEEYYNALRTNIQLSGNNLKVIAISSINPGEGKSTTSTNIAWAFARASYKTLLIDADIRNSVMSGVFKSREKITGLTDYLAGTQDLSHGLCETNVENLFVIVQKCDASILVTEAGEAKRREVQKAKSQLEQTGTPFLGVILNKFNVQREKYGSYGSYGSYGKK